MTDSDDDGASQREAQCNKRMRTEAGSTASTSNAPIAIMEVEINEVEPSVSVADNNDRLSPPLILENPSFQPRSFESLVRAFTTSDDEDSDSASSSSPHVMQDHFDFPVLTKKKPPHNWYMLKELERRTLGGRAVPMFKRLCCGALRNVQRLELMYLLEEHDGCVNCLNFHPDGSLLVSGSDDTKLVLWNWALGESIVKYKSRHRSNVFQAKFMPLQGSDLHIVSCARDGQVRMTQVSRTEGLRSNRVLGVHRKACHKLIVLKDEPQVVLSAGEDAVVLRHDLRCPKSYRVVKVKSSTDFVPLFSIDGNPLKSYEFCVCGKDEMVRTYDTRKADTPLNTFTPFLKPSSSNCHVTSAVYNYNGTEILASYSDEDIYLFDAGTSTHGSFLHQYQGHKNTLTIKGVNFFGPKSEFIVSGSDCGNIFFWERNSEAIVQWMLGDDAGAVNCLEPHPDLPFLCTSGLDRSIKVWVPSCEHDPSMEKLNDAVRNNTKARHMWSSEPSGERHLLTMLWRHLRANTDMRRSMLSSERFLFHVNATSTPTSSNSSRSSSVSTSVEDVAAAANDLIMEDNISGNIVSSPLRRLAPSDSTSAASGSAANDDGNGIVDVSVNAAGVSVAHFRVRSPTRPSRRDILLPNDDEDIDTASNESSDFEWTGSVSSTPSSVVFPDFPSEDERSARDVLPLGASSSLEDLVEAPNCLPS